MAVTLKSIKDARLSSSGAVLEAAGLVLDCGDGTEQTLTTLIIQQEYEVLLDVLDDSGVPTGEQIPEKRIRDVIIPISEAVQDVSLLREGIARYARDYAAGKAHEEIYRTAKLAPSDEVLGLLNKELDI